MVNRSVVAWGIGLGLVVGSVELSAQQRPLLTEDPEPVGDGLIALETGVAYGHDETFVVSGLRGNIVRAPRVGVSIGLGKTAEVQFDGISLSWLNIAERFEAPLSSQLTVRGDRTFSVDDFVVGAKIELVDETEGRPSVALRFATRLPNAGNEKGLGLDTMDFFQSLLVGKSVGRMRVVGNVGLGILSDPVRGDRQNDVLTYGFSVVGRVTPQWAVVGDVNGWVSTRAGAAPIGTETRGLATIGVRYGSDPFRLDGAVMAGLTPRQPSVGATGGLTWTFASPFARE